MSAASDAVRNAATTLLLAQFKNGGKTTERPYAALGIGLLGFEGEKVGSKSDEYKYKLTDTLRTELKRLKGDKTALGALAIGLSGALLPPPPRAARTHRRSSTSPVARRGRTG